MTAPPRAQIKNPEANRFRVFRFLAGAAYRASTIFCVAVNAFPPVMGLASSR